MFDMVSLAGQTLTQSGPRDMFDMVSLAGQTLTQSGPRDMFDMVICSRLYQVCLGGGGAK